jgi:DNA polymerase III epsilon subunit-like protein
MPAEAEAVHGLSDKFLADKPEFAISLMRFWTLLVTRLW